MAGGRLSLVRAIDNCGAETVAGTAASQRAIDDAMKQMITTETESG